MARGKKAKASEARYCPCGCGQKLANGSYFRMGHDGRVKGHFAKVDKGKMKLEDLTPAEQSIYTLITNGVAKTLREAAVRVESGDIDL